MSTAFDLAPLWRYGIGFDRLIDILNEAAQPMANHPPYDIEKIGEDAYRITLAVAGFRPDEVSITSEPNLLTVTGKPAGEQDRQFLYQGLRRGEFERRFRLADYVKVTGARMADGLLTIDLAREIPEGMRPRRIDIVGQKPQIEHQPEKNENEYKPEKNGRKKAA